MKKFILLGVMMLTAAIPSRASNNTITFGGPLNIRLTASFQEATDKVVSSSSNHTATVTNLHTISKCIATNQVIDTTYILNLLTNAFKTNFPAKAKLVIDGVYSGNRIYVTDDTGTNIFLEVTSVFSISNNLSIYTYTDNLTTQTKGTKTTQAGLEAGVDAFSLTFNYDDSGLTSGFNGMHSTFVFGGIAVDHYTFSNSNNKEKDSIMMDSYGWGTIRGNQGILQGNVLTFLSGFSY